MKAAAKNLEALNRLPASVVILDPTGRIVAVNETWKKFGRREGLRVPHSAVGANYLSYCRSGDPRTRQFVKQLKALFAREIDLLTLIYPCSSPMQERWFSLVGLPLSLDKQSGIALLHVNLTDMLPIPFARRESARSKKKAPSRTAIDFKSLSDAVQRSVSDSLTLQLDTMLHKRPATEQRASEGELAVVGERLSKRQLEVLRLLGEGKTNKEMARALLLSPNTVKLHVSAILRRLKLKSRTHAALLSSRLNKVGRGEAAAVDPNTWKKMSSAA